MAAFRQSLRVFADQTLGPAARSKIIAAAAKAKLAEVQSSGRASPIFRRFVDGRQGAAEESVRGDGGGRIYYQFVYMGDAVAFAIGYLRGRSPPNDPDYAGAFVVSINGRQTSAAQFRLDQVQPGDEVLIYNPRPYSRRVDMQTLGGKPIRFSVPPNLFDDAAKAVQRQWRGVIRAKRVYSVDFTSQYILKRGEKAGSRVVSPGLSLSQTE